MSAGPEQQPLDISGSKRSPPDLNCKLRVMGDQSISKCSRPDLNRELRIKVFRAGPQSRAPDQSVPCRTSITEFPKIYQIECQKDCQKRCRIHMPERIECQSTMPKRMPDRMSEYMHLYKYIYIYIYVCVCVKYVYVYIYIYMCVCVCMCVCVIYIYIYVYIYILYTVVCQGGDHSKKVFLLPTTKDVVNILENRDLVHIFVGLRTRRFQKSCDS